MWVANAVWVVGCGLLLTGCSASLKREAAARVAVQATFPRDVAGGFVIMHSDAKAVCGSVDGPIGPDGEDRHGLFIVEPATSWASVYAGEPSIRDYRRMAPGQDHRNYTTNFIEVGCSFPKQWAERCGVTRETPAYNEALCVPWQKRDYGRLDDLASGN